MKHTAKPVSVKANDSVHIDDSSVFFTFTFLNLSMGDVPGVEKLMPASCYTSEVMNLQI